MRACYEIRIRDLRESNKQNSKNSWIEIVLIFLFFVEVLVETLALVKKNIEGSTKEV